MISGFRLEDRVPYQKKRGKMTTVKKGRGDKIYSFDFEAGRVVAGKYEILSMLGSGWEGEVYQVRERIIGVDRAAKFFFPQNNHLISPMLYLSSHL